MQRDAMSCASVWQMKRDGGGQRALFAQQLALAPLMYIWDAPTSPPSLPNGTEKLFPMMMNFPTAVVKQGGGPQR